MDSSILIFCLFLLVSTICIGGTMATGFLLGLHARHIDRKETIKNQEEQQKVSAQKPKLKQTLQQTGVTP